MRPFAIALLSIGSVVLPADAIEAPVQRPADTMCQLTSPTFDTHEVSCVIPGSATPRDVLFKAMFSGGHDDTLVSIHPSLDDAELHCEAGSKTRSFAEDGDIVLQCGFAVKASTSVAFKATIRWSHAQFTTFELIAP